MTQTDSLIGHRMFGDYVIEKRLGSGGMGEVYLAKNLTIDQAVAIKVLHAAGDADNWEIVQRFNREAKTIARLTHPNIIRVFIFGRTPEGLLYLAMEFVKGHTLADLLTTKGQLTELHSIYIVKQVLGALAEAHDLGIVHRDLKPENILLTEYRGNPEFVKVVDFGIAKVNEPDGMQSQLTQAGVVHGTPEYLSPEQAQAMPLDGRSDLYSVGIILWELLAGKTPFIADTVMAILVQHVYDPVPDIRELNANVSPQMCDILDRVLSKDRNDRFANAEAFLAALEALEKDLEMAKGATDEDIAVVKTQLWVPPPGFIEAAATAPTQAIGNAVPQAGYPDQGTYPQQPAYPQQAGYSQQVGHPNPQQVAHPRTIKAHFPGVTKKKAMNLLTIGVFLLVVLAAIAVVLIATK